MGVELCPEDAAVSWQSAAIGSPRMSFSRDIPERESGGEHERFDGSLISGSDFDFCVAREGYDQEPSTADELFSDGKILPIPIQSRGKGIAISRGAINYVLPPQTPLAGEMGTEPAPGRETMGRGDDDDVESDKPPPVTRKPSTSFWKFGRSNSLSCSAAKSTGRSHVTSFIRSMALLTKSMSTGSSNLNLNPNPEQKHQKQQLRKTASSSRWSSTWKEVSSTNSNSSASSSSSSSLNSSYYYGSSNSTNNGVRISPVLNVPHLCIRKGGGKAFYGLGRLLCIGKERNSGKQRSV